MIVSAAVLRYLGGGVNTNLAGIHQDKSNHETFDYIAACMRRRVGMRDVWIIRVPRVGSLQLG